MNELGIQPVGRRRGRSGSAAFCTLFGGRAAYEHQNAWLQEEWQKSTHEVQTRMDKMGSDLQALSSKPKETDKPA